MCVCVCVCERERERESLFCVCVCVCERERERERERVFVLCVCVSFFPLLSFLHKFCSALKFLLMVMLMSDPQSRENTLMFWKSYAL